MKTGIKDLDVMLGDNLNGELIIIGSRPAMGKTSLALQIMANQPVDNNFGTYIFSAEPLKNIINKFYLIGSEVEFLGNLLEDFTIDDERISGLEFQRIIAFHAMQTDEGVGDSKRIMHNNFVSLMDKNIEEILYKNCYAESGSFVFVDYLQLINSNKEFKRHEEIEEIMKILKDFAIRSNIPVFVLSQLSRKVEERVGHVPIITDLAGSSAIEEIADKVIMLTRREFYDSLDKPGKAQIYMVKNRSGANSQATLKFRAETGNFFDYEEIIF